MMKKALDTDPHFTIKDQAILTQFLRLARVDPQQDSEDLVLAKLCAAFAQIPYENLTKIIKSDAVISAGSAKRFPDEVLRDYLHIGTGGTCFSLTAAFIAILSALGFEAHPILADRHYGTDTHCALVFFREQQILLLDPGFLIYQPTRLPTTEPRIIGTEFNTIELLPQEAGQKVELVTVVKNSRRSRLIYKVSPVDGPTFGRAWERSFAWEMMTYPVLTRYSSGRHYYLQGNQLRIRDQQRTTRQILTSDEQYTVITQTFGIHRDVFVKAFSVVEYGAHVSS